MDKDDPRFPVAAAPSYPKLRLGTDGAGRFAGEIRVALPLQTGYFSVIRGAVGNLPPVGLVARTGDASSLWWLPCGFLEKGRSETDPVPLVIHPAESLRIETEAPAGARLRIEEASESFHRRFQAEPYSRCMPGRLRFEGEVVDGGVIDLTLPSGTTWIVEADPAGTSSGDRGTLEEVRGISGALAVGRPAAGGSERAGDGTSGGEGDSSLLKLVLTPGTRLEVRADPSVTVAPPEDPALRLTPEERARLTLHEALTDAKNLARKGDLAGARARLIALDKAYPGEGPVLLAMLESLGGAGRVRSRPDPEAGRQGEGRPARLAAWIDFTPPFPLTDGDARALGFTSGRGVAVHEALEKIWKKLTVSKRFAGDRDFRIQARTLRLCQALGGADGEDRAETVEALIEALKNDLKGADPYHARRLAPLVEK